MKKIMIVDDEKFIRNGISAILNNNFEQGIEIELAKNGKEALELFSKNSFNLIITDINMPFINGIDFIKEVRKTNLVVNIIVISGYNEFEYARQCMKYSVKDYILKPINESELIELVSEYIKSEKISDVKIEQEDKKMDDVYIEKAKEFIENNYFKDINMAVVSNYVSLNYSYFSSLFNRIIKMNFSDYLNYVRVEKSKMLLKNVDYKIHEVSEMVGYKNSKHFTKNFKKFQKITPLEFKVLKRGQNDRI